MRLHHIDSLLLFSLAITTATARAVADIAAVANDQTVSSSAQKSTSQKSTTNQKASKGDAADVLNINAIPPPASSQKIAGGTKDAPVDGLDGKPHAGPWVAVDSKQSGATTQKSTSAETLARLEKEGYGTVKSSQDGWGLIPENNDGVMDDKNRVSPKKGTTGTEGGVTEKSKQEVAKEMRTGEKFEKKPSQPKEAPPLPHSEQKIKDGDAKGGKQVAGAGAGAGAAVAGGNGVAPAASVAGVGAAITATSTETATKAVGGLQKPTDLPDTPHDTLKKTGKNVTPKDPPVQQQQGSAGSVPNKHKADAIPITSTNGQGNTVDASTAAAEGIIQPGHSFMLAFVMILFSEIGDKTFLVAALMAMRHDRWIVFTAAFSALIAMTVLSAVVGHAVPTLFPRRLVALAAALLFLVFGAKLLREGLAMPKDSGVGEEMEEVEAELEEKEELARRSGRRTAGVTVTPYMLESGNGNVRRSASRGRVCLPEKARSPSSSGSDRSRSPSKRSSSILDMLGGLNNLLSLILSPAWVQTFVMTFLGEWGDRSQIATVAMAAGQDYWWVTGGAVIGHMACTGVAVLGGRALAGRVSMRLVTIGGAVAFLAFGVIYLFETLYHESSASTVA